MTNSLQSNPPRPFFLDMNASTLSSKSLNQLLAHGLLTELDYLTPDAAQTAAALEAELLADAAAGVDLRIRLIGAAVSA